VWKSLKVARSAFRVFAGRREDPDDPDGYAVPHSALTYLIDPDGHYVTHFPDVAEADRVVDSLKELVR
jgi:protein SCO1